LVKTKLKTNVIVSSINQYQSQSVFLSVFFISFSFFHFYCYLIFSVFNK
jgi:hypothetical protein